MIEEHRVYLKTNNDSIDNDSTGRKEHEIQKANDRKIQKNPGVFDKRKKNFEMKYYDPKHY